MCQPSLWIWSSIPRRCGCWCSPAESGRFGRPQSPLVSVRVALATVRRMTTPAAADRLRTGRGTGRRGDCPLLNAVDSLEGMETVLGETKSESDGRAVKKGTEPALRTLVIGRVAGTSRRVVFAVADQGGAIACGLASGVFSGGQPATEGFQGRGIGAISPSCCTVWPRSIA